MDNYIIDRLISAVRECERHLAHIEDLENQLNVRDEMLQAAQDRVAILESVELLAELKDIDNGTRKEQGQSSGD